MLNYETVDYENDIGAEGIGYDWTHFYDKIDLQNL